MVPDVLKVGKLHRDRDDVNGIVHAQFFLSAHRDVRGSFGEGGDLVVAEVDISFGKDNEGVAAVHEDLGCTLH